MGVNNREHKQFEGSKIDVGISPIIAAAHELKSPLALVRQLSLMLESGQVNETESKRILRQITLTSERALRLTADLTRSANLSGAMFQLEPINPQQLCEDIVHELTPLFKAHDRSVRLVTRKHPLLLVANRDLLRRIILNFSDNALHYAGVDSPVEIHIRSLNHGKTVRLGVRDFGPSLSSDMWRSLRSKLATAPQVVNARPLSSGLGLYISGQFADAMSGQIGVTRHRDGATFYVDLFASHQLSLL